MKIKSIRTKIALTAGFCLIITSIVLVGYNVYSSNISQKTVSKRSSEIIKREVLDKLQYKAIESAKSINLQIEKGLESAKSVSTSISAIKSYYANDFFHVLNRKVINNLLEAVLNNNSHLHGTYSGWEPNAFDGNDADIESGRNDSDKSGRYVPYITRNQKGHPIIHPLNGYDSSGKYVNGLMKNAWYQIPQKTGKEVVTAPIPYQFQGKRLWLASMSVPIFVKGKFVGVAGTDFNLDYVQNLAVKASQGIYNGKSHVVISTDKGLVVADSQNAKNIGQSVRQIYNDKTFQNLYSWLSNDARIDDENSHFYRVLVPISFGDSGVRWFITLEVSKALVLNNLYQLNEELAGQAVKHILNQIAIGVSMTIVALLGILYFSDKLSRPILSSVKMAQMVSKGRFDSRLGHVSSDEIGQLSEALDEMAISLQKQVKAAETVAQGDLTIDIELASEQDQLGLALKKMVEKLSELIQHISTRSGVIAENAAQISGLSQTLASGATTSASSVTEINSTISHIAQQIRSSSEDARHVSHLSGVSNTYAVTASEIMNELSGAMVEIESSGNDINTIISSIEGIAEQTNLLALNAAIEAARAGEAGRGFTVVAEEVRNLAVRCANAVQETSTLIKNSATRTKRGIELTDKATQSLQDIVNNVSSVSTLMEKIAQASTEQSVGAELVSQGINQIDSVTHGNRSNSELCASAAELLTKESSELAGLVKKFRL
ncbi:methyl-accepting chemotaxis protein [Vibrio viridaestus]|uniref:Methyl-accepting chemotaxis protein n=1 Tax=Vibrio viridaestus TaxID=2487322 RepID=A0A3N9TL77_9VIBR|nr:methyl-accepting chemotaxis protein [Vibrio viridaestus]RQW65158.1 methyl-accepting chemotaxis protein [Vibrio viridaestus]